MGCSSCLQLLIERMFDTLETGQEGQAMVGTATRDNPADVIVDVAVDVMKVDIGALTDDELADHIVDIEQLRARMDGQLSVALARLENSRAYESDGAVTAKSWLKHHVRMTGPQAGARLKVARRLRPG